MGEVCVGWGGKGGKWRVVGCAFEGCRESHSTRSPNPVWFCKVHREEVRRERVRQRMEEEKERRAVHGRGRGRGRPPSGVAMVEGAVLGGPSVCDGCAFLARCREVTARRLRTDPACFVDSVWHDEYLALYEEVAEC